MGKERSAALRGGDELRPRVGLALSAGAARGIAHLGVLQVFKEHNVPIDVIAGTSAGAVVASLYAAGCDLYTLERFIQELNWNKLVNITLPRRGLVSSNRCTSSYGCLPAIRTSPTLPFPLPW